MGFPLPFCCPARVCACVCLRKEPTSHATPLGWFPQLPPRKAPLSPVVLAALSAVLLLRKGWPRCGSRPRRARFAGRSGVSLGSPCVGQTGMVRSPRVFVSVRACGFLWRQPNRKEEEGHKSPHVFQTVFPTPTAAPPPSPPRRASDKGGKPKEGGGRGRKSAHRPQAPGPPKPRPHLPP